MPEQSFLYREIHQQPDVLRTLLAKERESVARLAAAIRERDITYVLIVAALTLALAVPVGLLASLLPSPLASVLALWAFAEFFARSPELGVGLLTVLIDKGSRDAVLGYLSKFEPKIRQADERRRTELLLAVADYQNRERRFGALPSDLVSDGNEKGGSLLDPARWKHLLKARP